MNKGEVEEAVLSYPIAPIVLEEEINSKRALNYEDALEYGLEPVAYSYKNLPIGKMVARLDFKIWGTSSNLSLFFTDLKDGMKYKISVFQVRQDKEHNFDYSDKEQTVDFAAPFLNGTIFELEIEIIRQSGNFRIKKAVAVVID